MSLKSLDLKGRAERRVVLEERESIVRAEGEDDRTYTLSFASEFPVDRGSYIEVLSHEEGAADYSLLNNNGPVLFLHDKRTQVGAVKQAWPQNKRSYAKVKMSRNKLGEEVRTDLDDGIITLTSCGYEILDYQVDESSGPKPVVTITKYRFYEISFENRPADPTVGVGRSIENFQPLIEETREMTVKAGATAEAAITQVAVPQAVNVDELLKADRERVDAITSMGEEFGLREEARTAAKDGLSVDQFHAKIVNSIRARSTPAIKGSSLMGVPAKEQKNFSLVRALEQFMDHQKVDGYEGEMLTEGRRNLKHKQVNDRSIFLPFDVLDHGKRDTQMAGMTISAAQMISTEQAGTSIENTVKSANYIDYLYSRSVAASLGVDFLGNNVSDFNMPKQLSTSNYFWIGEKQNLTKTGFGLGSVDFSPKTVGSIIPITRRMLIQNTIQLENRVRNDMAMAIARAIDVTLFTGTGAMNEAGTRMVQPKGILTLAKEGKIKTVPAGGASSGGPITREKVIEMETAITAANAAIGPMAYVTNAKVRGKLKNTPNIDGAAAGFVWSTGRNGEGEINGYRALVTEHMPSDLTKGTDGKGLSAMILGCFSSAIIATWGNGVEIQLNPYSEDGSISLRVLLDLDINFMYPEAFSVIADAAT